MYGWMSTWAGEGEDCTEPTDMDGGQNDGVILIGEGWQKIDPAAPVAVEDWTIADNRGGKIEYRPDADCIPACNGTPEEGCVNYGEHVFAADHMLLITKVRTAFP